MDPGQGLRTPGLTCEWAGKGRRTGVSWPGSEDSRTDLGMGWKGEEDWWILARV